MKVQPVPIDLIELGPRVRPVDAAKAAALASDIEARGLRQPIELEAANVGRYRLITGAHRLAAFRRLGRETIDAVVLRPNAAARARDELMENLARAELTALQRAQYLSALHGSILEEFQSRARVADGDTAADEPFEWSAVAARRVGMSARSVERYAAIGWKLDDGAADSLRGTELEDKLTELDALSRFAADRQRRIVELLTKHPSPPASVAEAARWIDGNLAERQADADGKFVTAMIDRWRRAPAHARRAFAAALEDDDVAQIAAARGYALVPRGDEETA